MPSSPPGRGPGHALPALVIALLVACTSPEGAPRTPTGSPATAGTPATSASPSSTTRPGPSTSVAMAPPPGGSFLVRGRYPFRPSPCLHPEQPTLIGRFPGVLHVRRSEDGTLTLTVSLTFERYLEGIAEVPASWPSAALEAQAIAARSYALATTGWDGREGAPLEEPICATTSCQVYRGIPVPPDPDHPRWVRAVRRTDGRVLLHDGRPATTVYFSTSNGRTYSNEDVFGSSPLPYLRSVRERDDGRSPTSRWRVAIPFRDLTTFLRRAERWPAGRAIARVRARGDSIVLRGGGTSRTVDVSDLRDAVNIWAPCLRPGRYPSRTPKGTLPLTIPSRWLRLSVEGRRLVATGRGWGHGAGMVQWGAYGKARQGFSASQILAYYYGGLRPETYPEPGTIRVQIATGLVALRIVPSGPGGRIGGRALGTGPVVVTGGDTLGIERAGRD